MKSCACEGEVGSASDETPTVLLIYSSPVKGLSVIEERPHLRKNENIHCHLI